MRFISLRIMTPAHDEAQQHCGKRLNRRRLQRPRFLGTTEVFLLPFHLFSDPTVARSLLRYRWHNLPGAQEKARRNGWQGALFPWKARAAAKKRRRNLPPLTFAPGCGKKWPRRSGTSSGGRYRLGGYSILADQGDESFIAHEGMALLLETAKFLD